MSVATRRARDFRKNLTPQEARLWLQLRTLRAEGFHFRRQAPFKGYFLDFVCFKSRLVVEVDGGGHYADDQANHDLVRDKVLNRQRFMTLRISNADINTNMDGVIEAIRNALIPPSLEVGRVDSGACPSGAGTCGSSAMSRNMSDFPTPVASRLDPPHEGEGGR